MSEPDKQVTAEEYLHENGFGTNPDLAETLRDFASIKVKEACEKQRDGEILNFLVWYQGTSQEYKDKTLLVDVAKEYSENPIPHHLRNKST